MKSNHFSNMDDATLAKAYDGYRILETTGVVKDTDGDGVLRKVIDNISKEEEMNHAAVVPVITAEKELLNECASRWVANKDNVKMPANHVYLIQYSILVGGVFKQDMYALFDERDFSEAEARDIAKSGVENQKIVTMCKEQYENVFRSLLKK